MLQRKNENCCFGVPKRSRRSLSSHTKENPRHEQVDCFDNPRRRKEWCHFGRENAWWLRSFLCPMIRQELLAPSSFFHFSHEGEDHRVLGGASPIFVILMVRLTMLEPSNTLMTSHLTTPLQSLVFLTLLHVFLFFSRREGQSGLRRSFSQFPRSYRAPDRFLSR